MNQRRRELLKLLSQNRYFTNNELAEELAVSTRTIRNDLDKIESILDDSNFEYSLIKKPGVGVKFTSPQQSEILATFVLDEQADKTDEQRLILITYQLLTSRELITLDLLAEKFYTPKNVIRQDLDNLKPELKKFHLKLQIRTKLGIYLEGSEKDKRTLLTKVLKTLISEAQHKKSIKDFFKDEDVELVEHLVKDLENKYNLESSGTTFNSIVIHLLFMLQRTKAEQSVTLSAEEWNLIRYSSALKMAKELSEQLSQTRHVSFNKEEIGYLALRIAAYYTNHNTNNFLTPEIKAQIDEMVVTLISNMQQVTGYDLSADILLQKNLKTHLQSTFTRILTGAHIANPLRNKIQESYPQQFMVVQDIVEKFGEDHNFNIPTEEVAYLTVHLQGAIERLNQKVPSKYKTIIVCNYGVGISAFIEAKLEHFYQNIEVIDHIAAEELQDYNKLDQLDFIISTLPLKIENIEIIQISPLFELDDQAKLQGIVSKLPIKQHIHNININKFTSPFLVFPHVEATSKVELLTMMANRCFQQGFVTENFLATVLSREDKSSTRVGGGIALPHGKPAEVKTSFISIATLKNPLKWDDHEVQLVIMIGFEKSLFQQKETKELFSLLNYLSQDSKIYQQIITEDNPLQILKHLSEYK